MSALLTVGTNGQYLGTNIYPLTVNAYGSTDAILMTYFYNYSGTDAYLTYNTSFQNLGIYSYGAIVTNSSVGVQSDERIKTNIKALSTADSLDKIRKITPCSYEFIDKIKGSPNTRVGFIANDVKKYIEGSTSIMNEHIPNIYELGDVKEGNIITLRTKTTDLFTPNESGNSIKIRLYDSNNTLIETFLEKIIDTNTFQITTKLSQDVIFVFGQEVENLLVLHKEIIFTHVTSAVKELDSIVEKQKLIINNLESRLSLLESKL